MVNSPDNPSVRDDIVAVLLGGLIAGTIDIGAAALISALGPVVILHVVAGGLLGRTALADGASVALLGMVLQWVMSIVIAAIYVVAARRLPALRRRWIAFGALYGIVVFFVMNFVVVPLSAWSKFPRFTTASFVENMVAMIVFGVIIAFFAQRASHDPAEQVARGQS